MEQEKKYFASWWFFGIALLIGTAIIFAVFNFFSDTAQVAHEEFGPRAMLKKYEYFKDASQEIVAKENNIVVYESKIGRLCVGDLDRISRENCALYEQELAGLKMSYNSLAAEYNAQSNKFNWKSFDQTEGDVLPKTFKTR